MSNLLIELIFKIFNLVFNIVTLVSCFLILVSNRQNTPLYRLYRYFNLFINDFLKKHGKLRFFIRYDTKVLLIFFLIIFVLLKSVFIWLIIPPIDPWPSISFLNRLDIKPLFLKIYEQKVTRILDKNVTFVKSLQMSVVSILSFLFKIILLLLFILTMDEDDDEEYAYLKEKRYILFVTTPFREYSKRFNVFDWEINEISLTFIVMLVHFCVIWFLINFSLDFHSLMNSSIASVYNLIGFFKLLSFVIIVRIFYCIIFPGKNIIYNFLIILTKPFRVPLKGMFKSIRLLRNLSYLISVIIIEIAYFFLATNLIRIYEAYN